MCRPENAQNVFLATGLLAICCLVQVPHFKLIKAKDPCSTGGPVVHGMVTRGQHKTMAIGSGTQFFIAYISIETSELATINILVHCRDIFVMFMMTLYKFLINL